jgi:hypothetical protein
MTQEERLAITLGQPANLFINHRAKVKLVNLDCRSTHFLCGTQPQSAMSKQSPPLVFGDAQRNTVKPVG